MSFIKDNFEPPVRFETDDFVCRKLEARDVYDDYLAVMENIEYIQETRGGSWPTKELTFEADLIDLAWHQREFEGKNTFAYVVYTPDETEYVGCFYLYPPGYRNESSKDSDVDASWWVTKEMKEKGYYEKLYTFLEKWLKEEWGFSSIGFTNKVIPQ